MKLFFSYSLTKYDCYFITISNCRKPLKDGVCVTLRAPDVINIYRKSFTKLIDVSMTHVLTFRDRWYLFANRFLYNGDEKVKEPRGQELINRYKKNYNMS